MRALRGRLVPMHATQKAMARRLGVSASLVSRALRGQAERIGAHPATIQRIRAEAARCGYAPNVAALSLRGGATRMLGVVVRDFADPFFGPIVGALQRLAAAEGYALVMTGGGAGSRGGAELLPLHRYRLDGFILVGSDFQPHGIDPVLRGGAPVVRLGDGPADDEAVQVCVAQAAGFDQLLGHLRALGHRHIGYLGDTTPTNARREAVLRQALRAAGLPVRPAWFVRVPDMASGTLARTLPRLWTGGCAPAPTAVVAADDVMALALLRALHEAGARVPHDLSVTGVDDIPFAHLAVPALTTLRSPIAAMAERAFQLASGREPVSGVQRRFEVQPELVVRESCGPAPGPGPRIPRTTEGVLR